MLFLDVASTNPYYNLALEDYFFTTAEEDVFLLWQNSNTIVVGKYQNTIEEINQQFVYENCIKVARRLSGGGAVYHDMGNLNFTFITKKSEVNIFNFEHFTKHIVEVLEGLGVKAEFNSRNDITIKGRKFSGNSQYVKNDKILHHGTLLFDSNLEILVSALNVGDAKIESKAIQSIHERVTNIKEHLTEDITLDDFKKAMKEHVFAQYSDIKEYQLTMEDEEKIERLEKEKYGTWEWNYGESPQCNIRKEGKCDSGIVQAFINVIDGKINNIKFYGDFFADESLADLEKSLKGCKYSADSTIDEVLDNYRNSIAGIDSQWIKNLVLS